MSLKHFFFTKAHIMFPTCSEKLSSHVGLLVPASWKNIKTVADAPVASPEMTFWAKPAWDREDNTIFFFSRNARRRKSDPITMGYFANREAITVNNFLLSAICMAVNDWWLVLGRALSAAAGPRPLDPFCMLSWSSVLPTLEDKLLTAVWVNVREEILACVLKIWEVSDPL